MKCKRKTGYSGKPKLVGTRNNRVGVMGVCDVCGGKKFRFVSQSGSGLLGKLFGLPGGKIPVLGDVPLIGGLF